MKAKEIPDSVKTYWQITYLDFNSLTRKKYMNGTGFDSEKEALAEWRRIKKGKPINRKHFRLERVVCSTITERYLTKELTSNP